MATISTTADIDIDIDADCFDDDELIDELEDRGYTVVRSQISDEKQFRLDSFDFDVLYSVLDDLNNLEHRRVRDKLLAMEKL